MIARAGFVYSLVDRHSVEAPLGPLPKEDSLPQNNSIPEQSASAKRYSRAKLIAGLVHSVLLFALTAGILAAGVSGWMESAVRTWLSNDYAVLFGFAALFGLVQALVTFPLGYLSGYVLEHRYGLSNQTRRKWFWERLKGFLVGIPVMAPLLLALYYCLRTYGAFWWLPLGLVMFLVSVVLARVAPVLIFPLFYKFKPLEQGGLKDRILALCQSVGMKISGVFVFNMSKNTKKANAAFAGIGKSKRIILGDTLVANFTDEEIETVFAHELGHFKLGHLWQMMVVGAVSTFAGLFAASAAYEMSLPWFGFETVETIAALPLLGLWLGLYSLVTTPLGNLVSRANERAADRYAVETTRNKQGFINALVKLSRINLADASPHPLVEFLFYSHPSIEKRIQAVENI